ncbi:MAG: PAS domain-containing protein [Rhodospirillaceae bacterium]
MTVERDADFLSRKSFKLFLSLFVPVALGFAAMAWYGHSLHGREMREIVRGAEIEDVRESAVLGALDIAKAAGHLQVVVRHPDSIAYIDDPAPDRRRHMASTLGSLTASRPNIVRARLLDAQGRETLRVGAPAADRPFPEPRTTAPDVIYVSDPWVDDGAGSRASPIPVIRLAQGVFTSGGACAGALVFNVAANLGGGRVHREEGRWLQENWLASLAGAWHFVPDGQPAFMPRGAPAGPASTTAELLAGLDFSADAPNGVSLITDDRLLTYQPVNQTVLDRLVADGALPGSERLRLAGGWAVATVVRGLDDLSVSAPARLEIAGATGALVLIGIFIALWASARVCNEATRRALENDNLVFRGIVESSATAAFVKDKAGRFVYVNEAFGDLFGVPAGTLVDRTARAALPKIDADSLEAGDRKVFNTGLPVKSFDTVMAPEGQRIF